MYWETKKKLERESMQWLNSSLVLVLISVIYTPICASTLLINVTLSLDLIVTFWLLQVVRGWSSWNWTVLIFTGEDKDKVVLGLE